MLLALLVSLAGPALAVQPDEVMRDRALETRARALSGELRCLVCQNKSIDDSDAPLARDIRILIRERIGKGESNDAVRAYLVSRYGDFILFKPPFKPETLLLWLSPVITLGLRDRAALYARAARRARRRSERRRGSAAHGADEWRWTEPLISRGARLRRVASRRGLGRLFRRSRLALARRFLQTTRSRRESDFHGGAGLLDLSGTGDLVGRKVLQRAGRSRG